MNFKNMAIGVRERAFGHRKAMQTYQFTGETGPFSVRKLLAEEEEFAERLWLLADVWGFPRAARILANLMETPPDSNDDEKRLELYHQALDVSMIVAEPIENILKEWHPSHIEYYKNMHESSTKDLVD